MEAGPSNLLPPGWTSHISPTGRTYYHNISSGLSTYTIPAPKPPKREKPVSKTPIPHTDGWFKITTNKDNVFYFHPQSKTSEWLPPPQLATALKEMHDNEMREKERSRLEAEARDREQRELLKREKREKKRKLEEGVPITEFDAAKRARADDEDDDDSEVDEDLESIASSPVAEEGVMDRGIERKAPPVTSNDIHDTVADDAKDDNRNDDDDDEDEEWQRQIAAQMAAEADAEAEASTSIPPRASIPEAPSSLEEQKSAFMAHLSSLNGTSQEVNPMAPWDLELPKFSSHPTFLALPSSQSEKEDIFNEWCKLRIREKRAAKAAPTPPSTRSSNASSSRTQVKSASAEETFLKLLQEQVRSTRTKFSDFKAAFSRDPRFASFGPSDSEREKLFKQHVIQLGEHKRRAAEAAEKGFSDLLSDRLPGNYRGKVSAAKAQATSKAEEKDKVMEVWLEAKLTPGLVEDKRYDAVGSSTRRFELFGSWARGERRQASYPSAASHAPPAADSVRVSDGGDRGERTQGRDAAKAREKEEARARALREREEKVRRERAHISRINRTAFSAATREESLVCFRQLLLDAIHTPHVSYHSTVPQLARDPRFEAPSLSDADRERLFSEHQSRLAAKEGEKIGSIFARYAKSLDSHPDDVIALTLQDEQLSRPPLKAFADDRGLLEDAYAKWDRTRRMDAEKAFKEMLNESAFVDFWGRLKKQASTTTDSTTSASSSSEKTQTQRQQGGDQEEEDEDEDGERATLLDMAKAVDLKEIESVLRNDARFRAWRHEPGQREKWIREHLEHLAAPKKSFHR
ncbi:uncharacterized protein UTRI_04224_B [Ustilago trichophora]|uniref:Peptide-binding protein n=1 Tax=Ustilago trichophora TaxID=86804 RepID=A0A5C3EDM8_9BASI|nr:uncharacterized protein UTRI_04224_B [Ustilago trichophora]